MDKKDKIIQKFYGQTKPEKWDDDFDKLGNVSVNDIKRMMDDYAQCVLADVSVSLPDEDEYERGFRDGYDQATSEAAKEIQSYYVPIRDYNNDMAERYGELGNER